MVARREDAVVPAGIRHQEASLSHAVTARVLGWLERAVARPYSRHESRSGVRAEPCLAGRRLWIRARAGYHALTMRTPAFATALALVTLIPASGGLQARQAPAGDEAGWISIFDGKTLDGWKANEAPGTFKVEDGAIVVNGPRSHLFYVGPVKNHDLTNFEWKAEIMTFPRANSGMYFHTEYQQDGWPAKGYEVQVNNSHTDTIRTGSLYNVQNVTAKHARDNEWFTQHVIVQGKHVIVKVNGETLVDYTEPANVQRPADMAGRLIGHGTFALQGHDPGSKVLYRKIMVKPLP